MMTEQRLQEIDAGDVPEQRAIDECVTEIRRLRAELDSVTTTAVRLVSSSMCERHATEASTQPFDLFVAEEQGCARCLRADVEQAQQERDAATRREEESSAAQHARAERLQSVRDDCVRNEAALIADRDALKAKAEAADAELPPLPEGWREVPTCGAVRTYMCVNHAYRYVEVFLDGTVRISWALDLPTAITVLRHAERACQNSQETQ